MDEEKMEKLRADLIRRTKLERQGDGDGQAQAAHKKGGSLGQLRRQSIISRLLMRRSEVPADDRLDRRADMESLKYFFCDIPSGRSSSESSLSSWDTPSHSSLQKRLFSPMSQMSFLQMPKQAVLVGGRLCPALEAKHPIACQIIETSHLRYKGSVKSKSGRSNSSNSSRRTEILKRNDEKKKQQQQQQQHGHQKSSHASRSLGKMRPTRLLSCFSWAKSRPIRAHFIHCFVAALFLISTLAVYLGLSLSNEMNKNEIGIIMILLTILGSVWFCYAVMRLCLLFSKRDQLEVGSDLEAGSVDLNDGVTTQEQAGP